MSSTIKPTLKSHSIAKSSLKKQSPLGSLEKKANASLKLKDNPEAASLKSANDHKIPTTYDRSGKISKQNIDETEEISDTEDAYADVDESIEDPEALPEKQNLPQKFKSSRKIAAEEMTDMEENDQATHKSVNQKAAEISSKDSDTFYSVIDRQNVISEDQTGYTIEAYSPVDEKDNIRVSINNNKAIISGSRQSANKAESENRTVATNNYQTFKEEFNLASPIQSEGMQRQRVGDYVRIFIPKQPSK